MPNGPHIALITGASGALGAEVARLLSSRGSRLAFIDTTRGKERVEKLANELGGASIATGDLTVSSMWDESMPRIERELGGPPSQAAFIAGAWRGGKPLHEETGDDTWIEMMKANLETVHRGLRAVLPRMVACRRGSIVVIGTRAAVQPWTSKGASAYAASKAAVVALAAAVAAEVLEHGVRVNAVLPSTMDTPANRAAMPRADFSKWVSLGSAAGVIAFLLSDDARDVSGAAVPVYGQA